MDPATIPPLDQSDRSHLEAAEGWLELGDHFSANAELDEITPALRAHPQVLMVRWQVYAQARHWTGAYEIANALVKMIPDKPVGWIHRSYVLHEQKRTQEAWDRLLPAAEKFPDESTIPYNLACYACQLGNLQDARTWLARAIEVGGTDEIKLMALDDPDLEPLWDNIGQL